MNEFQTQIGMQTQTLSDSYIIKYDTLKFEPNELGERKLLGTGGFGKVYLGQWQHNAVAIKELHIKEMTAEAFSEFIAEVKVMTALHHDNVMELRGVSFSPYCMVMRFMPKGSLYSALKSNEAFPWEIRIQISIDISAGLTYLHSKNIIHRDLKSPNVLLDEYYRAKVSDFGLSQVKKESSLSHTGGNIAGSLLWMAPELFQRRAKQTEASDIYSLGVMLWEIASRQLPFQDAANDSLIRLWVSQGDREDIPSGTPEMFAKLIEQAWAQIPTERPTADKITCDLKSAYLKEGKIVLSNKEIITDISQPLMIQSSPIYVADTNFKPNPSPIEKASESLINSSPFYKIMDSKIAENSNLLFSPKKSVPLSVCKSNIIMNGHNDKIKHIGKLSHDKIFSVSLDNAIKVWNINTGECANTLQIKSNSKIAGVASLSERKILIQLEDKTLSLWDINKNKNKTLDISKSLKKLKGENPGGQMADFIISSDGKVITQSADKTLRIWNTDPVKCLKKLSGKLGEHTWHFAVALPNDRILVGLSNHSLKIWNINTGKCTDTIESRCEKEKSQVITALFSLPDEKIAIGLSDGTLKIWDMSAKKCITTILAHSSAVTCLASLSNGELVSGGGTEIKTWDINIGECKNILESGEDEIDYIYVLPGNNITTASNKTIKLWKPTESVVLGRTGTEKEIKTEKQNKVNLINTKEDIEKEIKAPIVSNQIKPQTDYRIKNEIQIIENNKKLNPLELEIQKHCQNLSQLETLQEDIGLYVPANGTFTPYSSSVFDLDKKLNDFIKSNKEVLLLLGESGAGKSLFGQALVQNLAKKYQPGDSIPFFISLPSLKNPKDGLMKNILLRHGFSEPFFPELKKTHKFFIILDAYDELNMLENFYQKNNLDEWQVKIMITCRPAFLTQLGNYKSYFVPFRNGNARYDSFEELYVAPFSTTQINVYIEQYLNTKKEELEKEIEQRSELSVEWLKSQTYFTWINQVPGLNTLVNNPFLLKITMQVLPNIVSEYQNSQNKEERFNMTSVKLYDAFVTYWFSRQEEKLMGLGKHPGRNLYKDYMAFTKTLAKKMHENHLTQVTYAVESDIFEEETTSEWDMFFSDNFIPSDRNEEKRRDARIIARKGCPLRKVGNDQYAFIHASLLDYFISLVLYDPSLMKTQTQTGSLKEGQSFTFFQNIPRHQNEQNNTNSSGMLENQNIYTANNINNSNKKY